MCVGVGGLITSAAIASGGSFSVAALGYPLYAAVSMGSVAAIIVIRRKSMKQERGAQVADPPDDYSREPAAAQVLGLMPPANEEFVLLTEAVARYGREVGPCKAYSILRAHAARRGRVSLAARRWPPTSCMVVGLCGGLISSAPSTPRCLVTPRRPRG